MSEQNVDDTPINENFDDLDDFNTLFHTGKAPEPKEEKAEDADEPLVEETDPEVEDDDLAPEDEDDEAEAKEEPKPKKNRFQERIDQLNEKARTERERADALEARLKKLEEAAAPLKKAEAEEKNDGPQPTDLNEDGSDKYPLGEFDPQYQRDFIKHTLKQEREAQKAEIEKEKQQEAANAERAELETEWQAKLEPAQERYPDFHERGEDLLEAFVDLDPAYGEFLSSTIMNLPNGPDVLYYLASNIDEANRITKLGAVSAVIALGRIDAQFDGEKEEKPVQRKKTSSAPPPPPRNKGTQASVAEVPDDTDDLDAFEAKFYKGSRK